MLLIWPFSLSPALITARLAPRGPVGQRHGGMPRHLAGRPPWVPLPWEEERGPIPCCPDLPSAGATA